ncbi:hypothetical protein GARC_0230 [Paraglaciecola arctica BSs20135]|uniref:Uncharacterized protein n=1 Tax=Paraglaciecola arctica BSs20135 TaxID=493475 RepID=K6YGC3_9ALTE|nr:hypothetical protein GARC_0230 [Paraglaciecola arctica BSs20135]
MFWLTSQRLINPSPVIDNQQLLVFVMIMTYVNSNKVFVGS